MNVSANRNRKRDLQAVAVACAIGYVVLGGVGTVLAAIAVGAGPRVLVRQRAMRANANLSHELATILELAARSARTGIGVTTSLQHGAEHCPGVGAGHVTELINLADAGSLAAATEAWLRRHPTPATAIVGTTIMLIAHGEVTAARGFEAAAAHLRMVGQSASEANAWATQARTSAALLVGAPVVLGGGALLVDPASLARVGAHPASAAAVLAGLVSIAVGGWWMARLVRQATAVTS